jgi:hypothetical protein
MGLLLLHGSNFGILVQNIFAPFFFLLQRTIFCCIDTFIEAKAGLRRAR